MFLQQSKLDVFDQKMLAGLPNTYFLTLFVKEEDSKYKQNSI